MPEKLLKHMARDKKVVGKKQILILARSIGKAFVYEGATREIIRQSWKSVSEVSKVLYGDGHILRICCDIWSH